MLNFYDFEVFINDWLVVIINPVAKTETVIVNDKEILQKYYDEHKNEIWIGYNNREYDQYILKGILCGFEPKKISDFIIVENKFGWQYSKLFQNFPMINFDVMLKNDGGLKSLEGMSGNSIEETSVPFDIKRKLTNDELADIEKYCRHDVEQTINVFLNRKEEFDAAAALVKIFNLPLKYIGKTGAQRVAYILGGKGIHFRDNPFDFEIVNTLQLSKYEYVKNWYRNPENFDYDKTQSTEIAGVKHVLAWGGVHGALPKYYGTGIFILADVTAYYPSLQLQYKFGYRNMGNPENFEKICNENLRLKALGDKKARLPYKIAANAISGQLKDVNSTLYDPRDNNAICVNGQLLLIDLIEKLEPYCQLIQSNTDGILIKIEAAKDFEKIDDVVFEWEQRTGMKMNFDIYERVFQKDVNNYLLVSKDKKIKTIGAYTKKLSVLDYNLAIVNKAIVNYMVNDIPVEKTVSECNELMMFQKIVKLSGKYKSVWHNGRQYAQKCFRVFASKNPQNTYIGKQKAEGATIEKFANTPEHCFLINDNIIGRKTPPDIDLSWYADIAYKRLAQYGVTI